MHVSLPPKLEQFVKEQTASGYYNNASEVIREALCLLQQDHAEQQLRLERLRIAIAEGELDIEKGKYTTILTSEEMDQFFEEL